MSDTTTLQCETNLDLPARRERCATLVLRHGERARVLELAREQDVVLGRQMPSDVQIDDPSLSRQHARFRFRKEELVVEDLGSTNGTYVDRKRVQRASLGSGATVQLGSVVLSVYVSRASTLREDNDAVDGNVAIGPRMRELYQLIDRTASSGAPVLVTGETGSGKELVARAVHRRSDRANGPLVSVNCAALVPSLASAILFGHERGAFTDAGQARPGLFERASGGVLFLDEIGDLPQSIQPVLLRVIESQRVMRVGGDRERPIDVRVVSATHHDLTELVGRGAFRQDLFYRLNTITLAVPPLRERMMEVGPLADNFVRAAARAWGKPVSGLDADALSLLQSHDWPGNVRELRNVVERGVLVAEGSTVRAADLELSVVSGPTVAVEAGKPGASQWQRSGPDFRTRVRNYEAELILEGLRAADGNQRAASRLLRIPLRTLATKVKEFDLLARLRTGDR